MDEKSWKVFTELAISQIEKSTEDTPTKMFIDTVNELFEAKKISVQMIVITSYSIHYTKLYDY